jgi:hypothetical protein
MCHRAQRRVRIRSRRQDDQTCAADQAQCDDASAQRVGELISQRMQAIRDEQNTRRLRMRGHAVASCNGNYLLNIGPDRNDEMTAGSRRILDAFRQWTGTYGESIYGTKGSPFAAEPEWGRFTRKAGTLFVHVFTWPEGGELRAAGSRLRALPTMWTILGRTSDPVRVNELISHRDYEHRSDESRLVVSTGGRPSGCRSRWWRSCSVTPRRRRPVSGEQGPGLGWVE